MNEDCPVDQMSMMRLQAYIDLLRSEGKTTEEIAGLLEVDPRRLRAIEAFLDAQDLPPSRLCRAMAEK